MVARDHSGRVVAALCNVRPYLTEPEGAEVMALTNAVDLCRQMGLEGDALLVVQSLQQEERRGGRYGMWFRTWQRL